MLASRLQANVLQIWSVRYDSLEHVAQHSAIDVAVLNFCGSACPRDVEDVRDVVELRELLFGLLGIRDVALNVVDGVVAVPRRTRTTCHAVDLPRPTGSVGQRENLGETVANKTIDADNESYALVLGQCIIGIRFFLSPEKQKNRETTIIFI